MRLNATMPLKALTAVLLAGSALALSACNDTVRPLNYEKGVYHGKPDKALTPEQVEALRQRGTRAY